MLTITELRKNESGQWRSDSLETLPAKIAEGSILWVDAEDPSEAETSQLISRFELVNFNLKEFEEPGRRSKVEEVENRVSCFVSYPSSEQFIPDAKSKWIALTVSDRWMVSVHKGHSEITCEIYKKISTHGYFALSLEPSTDILLYIFLDLILNEFFLVSDLAHEQLQRLSQEAASRFRQQRPNDSSRRLGLDIAKSREQVIALRQAIGPFREVVGRTARGEFAIVSNATLTRFEDLYDRTISLMEVVDTHREEIQDIVDLIINAQTLTTNNIIRVLTIISAIFLPLTLIAGIYGTNFGRGFSVPGSNFTYGFYVMIAVMIGVAVVLISVFRRKGWI
ncbi:MAG: magnesium transporter CorA family protein [Candidatus Bathyarchaeia archaeon]